MTVRLLILAGFLVLITDSLHAQVMHPVESLPAAAAIMDATNTRFYVKFDGPVDHAASTLSIFRNGQVVQTLHPRLNSAPNTLFGSGQRLPPGRYELRWTTRPMHNLGQSVGSIPFTVAPSHG